MVFVRSASFGCDGQNVFSPIGRSHECNMGSRSLGNSSDPVPVTSQVQLTERRKLVLRILREQSDPISFSELVTAVVEQEREGEWIDEDQDGEHYERVRMQLHHVDLSLLDDAKLVEYDLKRRTVSLSDGHDEEYLQS